MYTSLNIYDSFPWNRYTFEIHQIEKLRFLGISRYKFNLRFRLNLNLYRVFWVTEFRGCSIFSGICHTGWWRCIGCLKLQISFRKRAIDYRALLRKMTYHDKASYNSTPPCAFKIVSTHITVCLSLYGLSLSLYTINSIWSLSLGIFLTHTLKSVSLCIQYTRFDLSH